jgi:hypothetical protein
VVAPSAGSITSLVAFRNRGCIDYVNFEIDGVTAISTTAFGQILNAANVSGIASSEFIVVDRITGFPTGTKLHNATDYQNFPHRCQKQTGYEDLTATSGTNNTLGTTVNFKYPYPRVPSAQATSVGGFAGNVMALAGLATLSATQIRPTLASADATNWSATVTRQTYWIASIDEV